LGAAVAWLLVKAINQTINYQLNLTSHQKHLEMLASVQR
jgi:hypothetical protein